MSQNLSTRGEGRKCPSLKPPSQNKQFTQAKKQEVSQLKGQLKGFEGLFLAVFCKNAIVVEFGTALAVIPLFILWYSMEVVSIGGDTVSTWVLKLEEHTGAIEVLVKNDQNCNWQRLRSSCLIDSGSQSPSKTAGWVARHFSGLDNVLFSAGGIV